MKAFMIDHLMITKNAIYVIPITTNKKNSCKKKIKSKQKITTVQKFAMK